jgi:hypothetical protein
LSNLIKIAISCLICLAPLAIGGVHTRVALALAAASLALAAASLSARWRAHQAPVFTLSIPTLGMALVSLWCALQLIPLPPSLLALLSPHAADLYAQGWALVSLDPLPWRPISLDPARTADAALRWLALTLLASAVANLSSPARHIQRSVMAAGALTLAAGITHKLLGATHLWGVFAPSVGIRGLSTFVSNNHASAFFGLVAVAAALFIAPDRNGPRPTMQLAIGALIIAVALAAMAWHGSVGTLVAVVLCAAAPLLAAARQLPTIKRHAKTLAGVAGLLALAALGAAPLVWPLLPSPSWLSDSAPVRLDMLKAAIAAARHAPLTGVGAGAVERVIYPHLDWSLQRAATIPTIEAEPVEWLLTLGLPVGALLSLSLLAWAAVMPRTRDGRSPRHTATAQLALVAYVSCIAFVHFPFFTLGLAIPAVALLESGLIAARSRLRPHTPWRREGAWLVLPRAAAYVLGALASALLIAMSAAALNLPSWSDERFAQTLSAQDAQDAIRAVPTEGRVHYQLARQAIEANDLARASAHAELAWRLEPIGAVARLRAHVSALRGEPAAVDRWRYLFEGRFKSDQGADLALMLRHITQPAQRAQVLRHADPARWEQAVIWSAQHEGLDPAADLAAAIAAARPEEPSPPLLLARLYLANGRGALAQLWAERVALGSYPTQPNAPALASAWAARALRAQGREEEATARLDRAGQRWPHDPTLARLTLSWVPLVPPMDEAHVARVERALPAACTGDDAPAHACSIARAALKEQRGRVDEAAELLLGLAWREQDPMPLAQLYLRHARCVQLRSFESQWKQRNGSRPHKGLAAARIRCGQLP